jgi:hypothetical protein
VQWAEKISNALLLILTLLIVGLIGFLPDRRYGANLLWGQFH